MSYPGDQQQPGGWGPSQPPQSPYGPVDNQAEHGGPSYDQSQGGGPYDDPYGGPPPRDGGFGPGGSFGGSFGEERSDSYGGGPFEPRPPYDNENADPYGAGPGAYGPPPDDDDRFKSGSGRKGLIIGAAIVAGVVVIGGGTALALSGGDDKKPKASAVQPSESAPPPTPTVNPTPSPTETGRGDRLRSRATDPKPLSLNEIFKAKSFKYGSRRYVMTGRRSERKCSPPTHGTAFRKALAKGGCTQVLRATFSNGKFIGTIGVINLRTQTGANSVQVTSRQKDAFILALPGAGTTKKIGQGLSLTTAEVDGHYLIMSWVQYPNGKKIAKGDYTAVSAFVKATTYGSNLRTALNYRSMEGKPS
ncbi:hypothetical protein [Actinomadura sp. DC4]|uniref:hypothetical protein n=1 Tax=Actinomadura sp. DC4 TaxID=3055069 RepID=UPI0025AF72E3|nr:hypothetical protein [Actinomadura sp. DC4]MDN3357206.1 hypothetical protein [Actinomadura sp. DC4]